MSSENTPENAPEKRVDTESIAKGDLAGFLNRYMANRKSEATRIGYQTDLMSFALYLDKSLTSRKWNPMVAAQALDTLLFGNGNPKWSGAKAIEVVEGYKTWMMNQFKPGTRKREFQANTINRRVAVLKSIFKAAYKAGLVQGLLEIDLEKGKKFRDTSGPGDDNIRKVLNYLASQEQTTKVVRDTAIIRLLCDLALRRIEVTRLDVKDVDFEDRTNPILEKKRPVLWVVGKGEHDEDVDVPLTPEVVEALKKWLDCRAKIKNVTPDGPLFLPLRGKGAGVERLDGGGIYKIVAELGDLLGFEVSPHGFRHTAITEQLELNKGDLRKTQKFSRHKNIQTLTVYDDNRKDLKTKAVNDLADHRRKKWAEQDEKERQDRQDPTP